jgi:hypothetical protein
MRRGEGGEEDDSGEENEELECDDGKDSGVEDDLNDEEMEVGEDTDEEDDYMMSF